jgi:hypothetical protein
MAKLLTPSSRAATRVSQRSRGVMPPSQIQAYLLARETLRRIKLWASPGIAPDPTLRSPPGRS